MELNRHLITSTAVSALGGLLFGFDTAVVAGTTHQLTQVYALSPYLLGLTVSSALWGTVVGAMTAGYPGQRIGRRDSLRIMALFYVLSALGCGLAWSWGSLIAFRIIGGLGIGGSSVLLLCILPNSHRPSGVADSSDSFRSISWSEFCWPISRII